MNELTDTILIVDDNEDDVYALKRALKKSAVANPLQILTDGQQAIDYLSGQGRFADRNQNPLPFLIFLDIKMPYRDGFEVLSWMREQSALQSIAVVILTGSDERKDHHRADQLGARAYLVKPPTPSDLQTLMELGSTFWRRAPGEGAVLTARG